jgi:hypothetical protein
VGEPEAFYTVAHRVPLVVVGLDLAPVVATLALFGNAEAAEVITDGRRRDPKFLSDRLAGQPLGVEPGYFVDP